MNCSHFDVDKNEKAFCDEANKDDIKQFNDEINGIKPDIENNSDFQYYHCGRSSKL